MDFIQLKTENLPSEQNNRMLLYSTFNFKTYESSKGGDTDSHRRKRYENGSH